MARLKRARNETLVVGALLGEIFEDTAPSSPTPASPTAPPAKEASFRGLEARHALLLCELIKAGEWSWAEFEDRARALRLLPEGALETINDWSFEHFEEPLLVGGQALSPAEHLRPQLQAIGEALR